MSKIGLQLQKLNRPAAPIGFGFLRSAPARPRMLIMVHVDGRLPASDVFSVVECADAIVVEAGSGSAAAVSEALSEWQSEVPLGFWMEATAVMPADAEFHSVDFVVCDLDGPAETLAAKDRGTLVCVMPDSEPVRLRAVGEVGVEALILRGKEMDLTRVSAAVECRRVRSACARPVLLHVSHALEPGLLLALWRAGVDGLVVDSGLGVDGLKALRAAVTGAPFGARPSGGGSVAIGACVGTAAGLQPEEEPGEGDPEEDGDE